MIYKHTYQRTRPNTSNDIKETGVHGGETRKTRPRSEEPKPDKGKLVVQINSGPRTPKSVGLPEKRGRKRLLEPDIIKLSSKTLIIPLRVKRVGW